ncbi:hypothetical protein BaRGS_00007802 [Batillaria attramentaria]|uniref:Uncharacterized protein n=1 Tax=Batillaria attramentaria TaxID=370345 RepID=A0ABD0LPD0_9CAEN
MCDTSDDLDCMLPANCPSPYFDTWDRHNSIAFSATKGLRNAPGENNCFVNCAVQIRHPALHPLIYPSPVAPTNKGAEPLFDGVFRTSSTSLQAVQPIVSSRTSLSSRPLFGSNFLCKIPAVPTPPLLPESHLCPSTVSQSDGCPERDTGAAAFSARGHHETLEARLHSGDCLPATHKHPRTMPSSLHGHCAASLRRRSRKKSPVMIYSRDGQCPRPPGTRWPDGRATVSGGLRLSAGSGIENPGLWVLAAWSGEKKQAENRGRHTYCSHLQTRGSLFSLGAVARFGHHRGRVPLTGRIDVLVTTVSLSTVGALHREGSASPHKSSCSGPFQIGLSHNLLDLTDFKCMTLT